MAPIGLAGVAAGEISYAAFRAAASASTALAPALAAAEATATAALVGSAAAVVGAGVAGVLIGQAILRNLEYTGAEPPVRQIYKVAGGQGLVAVTYDFEFTNGTPHPQTVVVPAPFVGILAELEEGGGGRTNYYLLSPPSTKTGLALIASESVIVTPYIVSVTKVSDGQPAEARKVPSFPYTPLRVPFKQPTTIPIPGLPPFPITPEIAPAPEIPEDDSDTEKVPGVAVKIPELGLQVTFTPTGVRIGFYKTPLEQPDDLPPVPQPPTTQPPAKPECCEAPEVEGIDEIICRVQTIQDELLNDGFDVTPAFTGEGQSQKIQNINSEFFRLEVAITQAPVNASKYAYAAPANQVFQAGWYSWLYGDTPSDRYPIQFASSEYRPPKGVNGFMVGLNDGYLCTCIYSYRTEQGYIDSCER